MLIRTLLFLAITAFSLQAKANCDALLNHPQVKEWLDVGALIKALDFTKRPMQIDSGDIEKLTDPDLTTALTARIRLVKSIFENSSDLDSAKLLVENFDHLSFMLNRVASAKMPAIPEHHMDMPDVKLTVLELMRLADEEFALTMLAVANHHPFVILNDPRVIPVLVESIFSPLLDNEDGDIDYTGRNHMMDVQDLVREMIIAQRGKLLSGRGMRISTLSAESKAMWQVMLDTAAKWRNVDLQALQAFAEKLGLTHKINPGSATGGTEI